MPARYEKAAMTERAPQEGVVDRAGQLLGSRLDPRKWHPPDPPELAGALAENRELVDCERVVGVEGPEDVAFDEEGRLYAGGEDDTVYRTVEPVDGTTTDADVEAFADLDGRPLGMTFDGEELLVAATAAGLQAVGPDGSVETLADGARGRPIAFADDLHVDDGTVYLTDATVHDIYQDELFELRDTGRLLAVDRETGETEVVTGDLGFANGVEPHPDGDSLLVTETSRYRVTRCYVDGPREGESEVVADNLPGYPDNVDLAGDGTYWVAVPALRDALLDRIHHHPWLVRQVGRLPEWVLASVSPDAYGLVLEMDADGEITGSMHDPTGGVHYVTSATPREGALYLGTLVGDGVYRYDLGEE
jgi:sugar lactone lactonase YvrE